MKKRAKLKRKTVRKIVKNLIVLVALAVVAFASVLSWFKDDPEADSGGLKVVTKVDDGLEFYIMPPSNDDQYTAINTRLAANARWNGQNPTATPLRESWHKGEDVTFDFSDQEFKFMEGLFMCEVTSDGKTFNVPKLMQYDEVAYVDTSQDFTAAQANDEYLSFDLYFRSENEHDVELVYDSTISPNTSYPAGTYSSNLDTDYKDAAIGAVRMSIVNNSTRELLWIPGASVYFNGKANPNTLQTGLTSFSDKGAVFYNSTTNSLATRTGEGTNDHAYYADKSTRNVIRSTDSGLEGSLVASTNNWQLGSTASDNKTVVSLSNTSGEYHYGHIRVNLWIEGEDAEARLNFVGGKYTMALHFAMKD